MVRRKGFTLVELLVVIGIIALLIAILMPSLQKARRQAEAISCAANMQQLHKGFLMFSHEFKGWLPRPWFNHEGPFYRASPWPYKLDMVGWDYILASKYVRNKGSFRCPSDIGDWTRGLWTTGANLPDVETADDIPASYRMNSSNQPWAVEAVKLSKLRDQGRVIWLVEGTSGPPQNLLWHHVATHETNAAGKVHKLFKNNVAFDRHDRKASRANYLFLDGHVESMIWDDTWRPVGPPPPAGQEFVLPTLPVEYRGQTMWRQRYDVPTWPGNSLQRDQRP